MIVEIVAISVTLTVSLMLLSISPRLVILRNWFSCKIIMILNTTPFLKHLSSSMEVSNLLIHKEGVRNPDLLDVVSTHH